MNEKIVYRKATLADLDEIFNFVQAAIEKMNSQGIYQWDELYPQKQDFENDIKNNWTTCGIINGKIASIYTINREFDEEYNYAKWNAPDSNYMVLHRIIVNPDFQNCGVGRTTMLHLLEELKNQGVESLRLDVFPQNPYSMKMYQKLGFTKTGEANWRKGLFFIMEKIL